MPSDIVDAATRYWKPNVMYSRMTAIKYPIGWLESNGNLRRTREKTSWSNQIFYQFNQHEIYHNGNGNWNELLPESVVKYVTKLPIDFGNNTNCATIFTTIEKMNSLKRSIRWLILVKNLFDFGYSHPAKRYEFICENQSIINFNKFKELNWNFPNCSQWILRWCRWFWTVYSI